MMEVDAHFGSGTKRHGSARGPKEQGEERPCGGVAGHGQLAEEKMGR